MAITDQKLATRYCANKIADFDKVYTRVRRCPQIASLKKINDSLNVLTASSDGTVNEIAEVISRDMSLTSRLLRLVGSVYSGLSVEVSSVSEAIFYLGLKQIRQLALTTRVVDEIEKIGESDAYIDWQAFWRHSIGTGIVAREIISMADGAADDDIYYICGLLQDVGKLVMFNVFPDELIESSALKVDSKAHLVQLQNERFGWNYAQIGALYLEHNNMPAAIVEAVLFQANPADAPNHPRLAAGVELAETIVRFGGCSSPFDQMSEVENHSWEQLEGWKILFGEKEVQAQYAQAAIMNCVLQLPILLKGLL